eukprot:TRINITY_DN46803_c0_g1_i1.p1 TRINITY_DN46803_c0_g1~~TRINITY_DN46803_c0_g1_i1.p1  ORF type:complete len:432 (+),score=85.41 TRINITY_DN46803_c0_g1_i1:48-1343(+)
MAPVDDKFYKLLEVSADATPTDIKHAYRKKALHLHPDKGGDPEQFKAMQAAYDVLKDPRKREIYDQYGAEIVKMTEGNMVGPHEILLALSRVGRKERAIALTILLTIALAVVSPALLFSLKWDNYLGLSWFAAFIPLWVFQGLGWCCLITMLTIPPKDDDDDEDRAVHEERKNKIRMARVVGSLYILLLFAQEIFLALQLQAIVTWPWFLVLSPWYLIEILWLRGCVHAAREAAGAEEEAARQSSGLTSHLLKQAGWSLLRVVTISLLAARADLVFKGSWYLCLIPVFLGSFVEIGSTCGRSTSQRRGVDEEQPRDTNADEEENENRGSTGAACCAVGFWLIMVCGAAAKLDGANYSAFLVFIPLFLLVCCFTCIVSCFVVCLSPESVEEMERQSREQRQQQQETGNLNTASDGVAGYGSANSSTTAATAA